MRTITALACLLTACTLSPAYAQAPDSAFADLGRATRFTDIKGSVDFAGGGDGIEVINNLRGLDPKKKYDLRLLSTGCPAVAPLDEAGIQKLKQARKTAQRLLIIKGGEREANTRVKTLTLKTVISKGLLLSQGDQPVECADILPPPSGPPPAPADSK